MRKPTLTDTEPGTVRERAERKLAGLKVNQKYFATVRNLIGSSFEGRRLDRSLKTKLAKRLPVSAYIVWKESGAGRFGMTTLEINSLIACGEAIDSVSFFLGYPEDLASYSASIFEERAESMGRNVDNEISQLEAYLESNRPEEQEQAIQEFKKALDTLNEKMGRFADYPARDRFREVTGLEDYN